MERVFVRAASDVKKGLSKSKFSAVLGFNGRDVQKKSSAWEPKDSKADLKSKKKNKKHRAKQGFDKAGGNKSPENVAGSGKPEQLRSNEGSHNLKGKEECGCDG
jgi:hypothetical protein